MGLFTVRLVSGPRARGGSVEVEIHIQAEDDPTIRLEKTTRMMLPLDGDG